MNREGYQTLRREEILLTSSSLFLCLPSLSRISSLTSSRKCRDHSVNSSRFFSFSSSASPRLPEFLEWPEKPLQLPLLSDERFLLPRLAKSLSWPLLLSCTVVRIVSLGNHRRWASWTKQAHTYWRLRPSAKRRREGVEGHSHRRIQGRDI